jgi:hypothetical protein
MLRDNASTIIFNATRELQRASNRLYTIAAAPPSQGGGLRLEDLNFIRFREMTAEPSGMAVSRCQNRRTQSTPK